MAYQPSTSAAGNPTVNDDITRGYRPGHLWVNTAVNSVFCLAVATAGAAVWLPLALGGVTVAALPQGSVYWSGNAVATAIATQSTWTRVAPVAGTLAAGSVGVDRPADARARYIQVPPATLLLSAMLSFSAASPNDVFLLGLWKDGTVNGNNEFTGGAQVPGSTIRLKVGAAGDSVSSAIAAFDASVIQNDYYDLAIQNTTSTGDVTFSDANILIGGHPV